VLSQLKIAIRTNYSATRPHTVAAVVAAVLGNPELRAQWEERTGRNARAHQGHAPETFVEKLKGGRREAKDMSFITTQIGMFSYSGLVQRPDGAPAVNEFGVYGTDTGRMCVAALNSKNIDYVCARPSLK
jgi:aromatic-amino-acid transaminase